MSFSRTNKIRSQKREVKSNIKQIPSIIIQVQKLVLNTFDAFDKIGKELVNLAMFDIDPDLLEMFDINFNKYKKVKGELGKTIEDLVRISSNISQSEELLGNQQGGGGISESVIDDLQTVLTEINSTLGGDVAEKLEQIQLLKDGMESINQTGEISFEIFTKSSLEAMKNSVEMNAMLQNLENQFYEMEIFLNKSLPEQVKNTIETNLDSTLIKINESVETIVRSLVNDSLQNLEHKISKTIDSKLSDLHTKLSADIENVITSKLSEIEEKMQIDQTQMLAKLHESQEHLSRDMQEMKNFKEFLYTWPSSKRDIVKRIEEFRDLLLVQRGSDAPYRVTATNYFRESLNLLTREDRVIDKNKLREIIDVFNQLESVIKQSESNQ